MSAPLRTALLTAAIALGPILAPPALAQDFFVRAGVTVVDPKSGNGTLAGGTLKTDVGSDTQLGITVGYHFTPNLALELLASTKFTHSVRLNGAKAAEVDHLPPTLSVQYHFMPGARVVPFVGVGVNYTWLHDEQGFGPLEGARVRVDNSWGFAAQGGVRVKLAENLELVGDIRWIDIDGDVSVNAVKVGEVDIDPLVYSVMLGYRF